MLTVIVLAGSKYIMRNDACAFTSRGRYFVIDLSDLTKLIENTVEKGEIAGNEQFLLYPQCFQKTISADT